MRNRSHMDHVPWDQDIILNEEELAAISNSVATFQLGENAEGNTFKRSGKIYADQTGDQEYLGALDLFIKEEQSHSAALGRFMDGQGIERLEKEWTDSIFRYVRRLAGLNVCITVLITAEIIAAVYYRALGNATRSPVLRAICGQILIDEAHHLQFQAATLAKERCSWHPIKRWLFIQLHRLLLALTVVVVWKEHRQVYRAGGMGFFQWAALTWSVLEDTLAIIHTANASGTFELPSPHSTPITHLPQLPSNLLATTS